MDAVVDKICNIGVRSAYDSVEGVAYIDIDFQTAGHYIKLELCQFDRFTKDVFHYLTPVSGYEQFCRRALPPVAARIGDLTDELSF